MTNDEPRRKAKPREIKRFYELRDMGHTVPECCRILGFKKSWGYEREAERRRLQEEETASLAPTRTLKDAVEFVVSGRRAEDEDDPEGLLTPLRGIAWSLALDRAVNLQTSLEALFHTEDWFEEFRAQDITAEGVLEATLRQEGDYWWPERLRSYIDRYLARHPEIPSLEAEIEEAFVRSERASSVLRELRDYAIDNNATREEVRHA